MGEAALSLQAVPVLLCRDSHPGWGLRALEPQLQDTSLPTGCGHLFRKSRFKVMKVKSLFSPARRYPGESELLWLKEQEVIFWGSISWCLRKE